VKTLVLGGVRSGKSRYAEALGRAHPGPVTVIATATADDEEMCERIESHRRRRPCDWQLIEEPVALAQRLEGASGKGALVIVECLTLWLMNLCALSDEERRTLELDALPRALSAFRGQAVLVANEVGLGVVPVGALSRTFVDRAGALHQEVAAICNRVVLTVAGFPITLKDDST
jgi:adenosylcobinamide kinase/adenosylcobinamide-phosphate guanylyltransferase